MPTTTRVLLLTLLPLAATAQEPGLLVNEDFEADTPRVQIHGSNQPCEVHLLGPSAERAHSGKHSLKVDLTFLHGTDVMLSPRTDETPGAEWGSVGGPGWFVFHGLGLPLRTDRHYLLSLYVWVEQASPHNPVRFGVETATDSPYGVARTQTPLPRELPAATGGWVKVEYELTGLLLERLEAAGAKVEGLRLDTISLSCFANTRLRLTAFVDDVQLRELPLDAPLPADENPKTPAPEFRRIPAVEDRFVWGVYGDLYTPGPDWFTPLDRSEGQEGARRDQVKRLPESADWILLDLRRHYCDSLVQGGGMLFATEGQAARDYVKACLDQCGEYGISFAPSAYLTQHYIPDATREQCVSAMRTAVGQFGSHPALLAWWLVDEPQPATAADYYWGKAALEELDPRHPALCACNSISAIAEFAPTVPLLTLDLYPLGTVPKDDRGAWAVADAVRYARRLGGRRLWVLPQVFGHGGSWRAPSTAEVRLQLFGCLAEGATGFLPYSYADRPSWHNSANEHGHLVDPYGNPTPAWEEMGRLGLHLRAAAPLLVGAERLPDDAAGARLGPTVVSGVGRVRPAAITRAFAPPGRELKVLVVHNNTTAYRYAFPVGVAGVKPGDRVLDLFSLREFPLEGDAFVASLGAGDGRLYAVGQPAALAAARAEVAGRQVVLQADLLALEVKLARRMGTDTGPVEQSVAAARGAAGKGAWETALAELQTAFVRLPAQQRANAAYWPVEEAVERTRAELGRLNVLLAAQVTGNGTDYPRDDPDVKARTDRLVGLSGRFYKLQAQLLRQGPAGLLPAAIALQSDVEDLAGSARVFFGG
ncbi:MAG: hypothetical protein HYU66_10835 [Armatimonadetes bacterium]|nr:hypothetical protein [Armatimonadota bacterium]